LSVTCDRSVVFSTNNTDQYDMNGILLKVALHTITLTHIRRWYLVFRLLETDCVSINLFRKEYAAFCVHVPSHNLNFQLHISWSFLYSMVLDEMWFGKLLSNHIIKLNQLNQKLTLKNMNNVPILKKQLLAKHAIHFCMCVTMVAISFLCLCLYCILYVSILYSK